MRFIDYIKTTKLSADPRGMFIQHCNWLREIGNGVPACLREGVPGRYSGYDYKFPAICRNMLTEGWKQEYMQGMMHLYYEYLLFELASRINVRGCNWGYIRTLQDEAAQVFAQVNDWSTAQTKFSTTALRDGKVQDGQFDRSFPAMDHDYQFRSINKRAVCLVAHIYDPDEIAIKRFAQDRGLIAHFAPDEMSWYFPGWATPVAYTRPDTAVIWPWYSPLPVGTFAEPVKRIKGSGK